jgi:glutamate 5-kinase
VRPDKGEESTGGMKTKLEAVRKAISAGITCHIIDGRIPNRMQEALAGKDVGTAFGK